MTTTTGSGQTNGAQQARATKRGGGFIGVVGAQQVQTAGASVWWECGQGCTRSALCDAWDAAGLDPKLLPADKSMEAALHDAVNTLSSARVFVRRAPGSKGWLLVAEREDAQGTDTLTKVRWEGAVHAELDKVGRLSVNFRDPNSSDNAATEQRLRVAYLNARTMLTGDEVTRWIGALLTGLKAVLLRARGGLWFVPGATLPDWHAMADCIAKVSGTCIEEMTTVCMGDDAGRTVATIMSAVKRDAMAVMEDTLSAIAKGNDAGKPLGAKALETQQRNLRDAMTKVQQYEQVLGVQMDELRGDIEALRATVAAQAVASSSGKSSAPVLGGLL